MPELGDTVFIAEQNPLTDEVTTSVAFVVGIPESNDVNGFSNDNGDVVELFVLHTDGTTAAYQAGPGTFDDNGDPQIDGYVTSPKGSEGSTNTGDAPVETPTTVANSGQESSTTQTIPPAPTTVTTPLNPDQGPTDSAQVGSLDAPAQQEAALQAQSVPGDTDVSTDAAADSQTAPGDVGGVS